VKIFALLLAMVVLTLTVTPCCALEERQAHTESREKKEQHHNSPEKDDDCCKDCSPFYVCGTCAGFTFSGHSLTTFTIYLKPEIHRSTYLMIELRQILTSIWQPPKIA
jgi:hypothetical protein